MLLAAGSALLAPTASAAVTRSVETKVPLPPTISFPNGDSVVEGGQLAVRFDANGHTKVASYRYSVDRTSLGSTVPAGRDGSANVTIDVGNVSGNRPIYAVAVDRQGRISSMTANSFTVSVLWSLRGRALDITTFLPVVGATIRLEPVGIEVVTDSDGVFQFAVDPGLYSLAGTYAGPPSLSGSSQQLEVDGQGLWFDLLLFPDSGS
ncbi:hypothetical protein C1I95_15085 [Micromonospora craterilacus]|uniref:Carboxypeptidase regulatory-like domain-containing protein n=1 Tax=Micromonospora craterilacus TaxID=1655439 RepID=A0A2W2E0G2_9ACTN|nr:hypothetical protein [Micromonospora craterilacus]PZG17696.1 hypothetical protein C1I95_15085 [Micromonospora craterilacus]